MEKSRLIVLSLAGWLQRNRKEWKQIDWTSFGEIRRDKSWIERLIDRTTNVSFEEIQRCTFYTRDTSIPSILRRNNRTFRTRRHRCWLFVPSTRLIHGYSRFPAEGGERTRESAPPPGGWKKNSDNLPRWDRSPCNSSRRKRCCSSEARASGNGTRPDRFARYSRRSSKDRSSEI